MKKTALLSAPLLLMFALFLWIPDASAINAVASIKDIQGQIDIERQHSKLAARNGLILYDNDTVVTGDHSKATIVFRDGSIIRLFGNTRFMIEKSVEAKKGSRRFLHKIFLKLGSFWGKFSRKYQNTTIRTPTATAGIKGTIIVMTEQDGKMGISLTTGAVTINNDSEAITLQPGQMLMGITQRGSIGDKIQNLPYRLIFKSDHPEVIIPGSGNEVEIFFTLQMVQKTKNLNASRTGPVYISHSFDNIRFEPDIHLNERGYARIKATVQPFQGRERLRETAEITALMDGETFIDVDAGQVILALIQAGQKAKTLKVDVKSDRIE